MDTVMSEVQSFTMRSENIFPMRSKNIWAKSHGFETLMPEVHNKSRTVHDHHHYHHHMRSLSWSFIIIYDHHDDDDDPLAADASSSAGCVDTESILHPPHHQLPPKLSKLPHIQFFHKKSPFLGNTHQKLQNKTDPTEKASGSRFNFDFNCFL